MFNERMIVAKIIESSFKKIVNHIMVKVNVINRYINLFYLTFIEPIVLSLIRSDSRKKILLLSTAEELHFSEITEYEYQVLTFYLNKNYMLSNTENVATYRPDLTISNNWSITKILINLISDKSVELQCFISLLLKIVLLLLIVAYFTVAERKVMAAIQRRRGPNVVGILGIGQPLADGAKLIVKEVLIPTRSDSSIFLVAPIAVLILSILNWSIIPRGIQIDSGDLISTQEWTRNSFEYAYTIQSNVGDLSYGLLMLLAISGFNVYGIIMAGWSSNSKYAFLGGLRSAAQMISYEVSLGLLIIPVILLAGSLNLTDIVMAQNRTVWFFFPLLPCAWMFFISILAETNRAPFDLPEAEAELVAGYNVEYSSIIFAMFFLGEYANMLLMATIMVFFFFGGWLPVFNLSESLTDNSNIINLIWLSLKILFFCHLYILIRAGLPRLRYDQLMELGWKIFLPLSLGYLLYIIGILYVFKGLPQFFELYIKPESEFLIF